MIPKRATPLLLAALIGGPWLAVTTLQAQDANSAEVIKQLQKRIEELEQKVKTIEGKSSEPRATEQKTKQRVEELDQEVKTIERERRMDAEAAEARAREAPKISIGEQGFSLSSAKGDFALQLKGVLQVDSRTFFNDHGTVGNDGFL